jgi:uncharacterized protein YndB with AHSA1/START domain
MKLIQQSMLIRDTADNIYTALTSKEDVAKWWGLVNDDADGTSVWYGMDRQWPVPIVAMEPGKLLAFAFKAHHPYDADRTEPTEISITIAEQGNYSIVTVVQGMFGDDQWNELIHDGWGYTLLGLQLWVEQGRTFAEWLDKAKFHTIGKAITLQQDAEWAWDALTNGTVMSEWHDGEVHSDPVLGGALRIVRDDAYNIGGEWVLLSRPRNLVSHQWNATSLAEKNDPGVITVQQWLILPAMEGSVVTLTEYGHDRKVVTSGSLRRIERRWDTLLGNLQQLAATN